MDQMAHQHSSLVGIMDDGYAIYGFWEERHSLPLNLDGCNGHIGPVPADPELGIDEGTIMFHYHWTAFAPFSPSCFSGPVAGDEKVVGGRTRVPDQDACNDLYPDLCGDNAWVEQEFCGAHQEGNPNHKREACCEGLKFLKPYCACSEKPSWVTCADCTPEQRRHIHVKKVLEHFKFMYHGPSLSNPANFERYLDMEMIRDYQDDSEEINALLAKYPSPKLFGDGGGTANPTDGTNGSGSSDGGDAGTGSFAHTIAVLFSGAMGLAAFLAL